MTVVIAAINGKGGAGKTTALMNIAGEYALRGGSVAMIDMDAAQQSDEVVDATARRRTLSPKASKSTATRRQRDWSAGWRDNAGAVRSRADRHARRGHVDRGPGDRRGRPGDLADPAVEARGARRHRQFRECAAHQRGARQDLPAWRAADPHHRDRPTYGTLPQDQADHRGQGRDLSVPDRGVRAQRLQGHPQWASERFRCRR